MSFRINDKHHTTEEHETPSTSISGLATAGHLFAIRKTYSVCT
jgi:hypothetical protein